MSIKTLLSLFSLFVLGLSSCKQEKRIEQDHSQTIKNYSKVLDFSEQNKTNELQDQLNEMNVEENFHLQKLQKRQGEVQLILRCNQLLKGKKFNEAKQLIAIHIKQFGLSKALEDTSRTLKALENFENLKINLENDVASLETIKKVQAEMLLAFPKSKNLNNQKIHQWFRNQRAIIAHKNNQKAEDLRMIALLQIDQLNAHLKLDSKSGAEIYYHQLSRGKKISTKERQLANSIITLTTNHKSKPASISDLILQLYSKAQKQSIAETLIQLNEIKSVSSIDASLKTRILRASLSAHNIDSKMLSGPPLLTPPALMDLIIKSEQQD
ncbi:hypothetical protein LNTAR_15777 [Lentisphaera araneosa HTCC2155]|uniref:Lipoprotein n=1 Tax=Lentisphaera araneosa HTCC2155 TaxID=313628 RepID=A6DMF3_9BACT|nr:hypothetical protein [Lentisphaera araneosa]EDM27143.1 hypothetical protein LNTAR_15777 [Lentisphaera araneosa HTCC2155]